VYPVRNGGRWSFAQESGEAALAETTGAQRLRHAIRSSEAGFVTKGQLVGLIKSRLSSIQGETMSLQVHRVELREIERMRDVYRHEMNCQVIHDSIHARPGWTHEYAIVEGGSKAGYGSVAVAGPWQGKPTVYEYFLLPQHRGRVFDSFLALLTASGATEIETQSNAGLLTVMLHTFAPTVTSESILFRDEVTTTHALSGAHFRRATAEDAAQVAQQQLDSEARWLVEVGGVVAGAGDVLFHYNRPYGDIYMAVGESFRRRGIGTYLVQELKRVCYEGGSVPAARCNPKNIASRQTLQRAGFVPCGRILTGTVLL
jgi:GNAT superfamily N-acetyltransferase